MGWSMISIRHIADTWGGQFNLCPIRTAAQSWGCLLDVHLQRRADAQYSSQALCGIGEGQSHVHFMFVYRDPLGEAEYDDHISLSYKLPVLQEDEG